MHKDCHRQFIHETELSYQGCKSDIDDKIRLMLVRGCSIADIEPSWFYRRQVCLSQAA